MFWCLFVAIPHAQVLLATETRVSHANASKSLIYAENRVVPFSSPDGMLSGPCSAAAAALLPPHRTDASNLPCRGPIFDFDCSKDCMDAQGWDPVRMQLLSEALHVQDSFPQPCNMDRCSSACCIQSGMIHPSVMPLHATSAFVDLQAPAVPCTSKLPCRSASTMTRSLALAHCFQTHAL